MISVFVKGDGLYFTSLGRVASCRAGGESGWKSYAIALEDSPSPRLGSTLPRESKRVMKRSLPDSLSSRNHGPVPTVRARSVYETFNAKRNARY